LGTGFFLFFFFALLTSYAEEDALHFSADPSKQILEENPLKELIPSAAYDRASSVEKAIFLRAKEYFDAGNTELSLSYLKDFILNHQESPLLSDTYLLLSIIYSEKGGLNKAAEVLNKFIERFPREYRLAPVQNRLSEVYLNLGKLKKVLELWEGIPGERETKKGVYQKLATRYIEDGKFLDGLRVMMKRNNLIDDPMERTLIKHEIALLIREKLSEEALQSVIAEFGSSYPSDEAMIRLIRFYETEGDYHSEDKAVRAFLSRFPNHHFATQARHILDEIKTKVKSDRYLIAVVLPLSGRLSRFGQKALHGAELAVELFKEALPMASVGLVVRDTEADPSILRMTFEAWLNEYSPIAVVGPLLSREVNRLAPIAKRADLAVITPGATARHLVSIGETVFRNAVTNRVLCRAIAEYAVLQLSIERFAVLYPDEPLGQRWVDCFSDGVAELEGEVVLVESYSLNNSDFSSTLIRLKNADLKKDGFVEFVEDEEKGTTEKIYTPGFEGIFLPADAVRAGLIIPQLLFFDFNDVRVLGTNSWNSSEFLDLVGPYADGVVFVDGFFKDSNDPIVKGFVRRFRQRFNEDPDLFAAQTFDATRLVLASLRGGAQTPAQVKGAISGAVDFPGVSGFIYEILQGEVIKEPFFIQVQDGAFVQVN